MFFIFKSIQAVDTASLSKSASPPMTFIPLLCGHRVFPVIFYHPPARSPSSLRCLSTCPTSLRVILPTPQRSLLAAVATGIPLFPYLHPSCFLNAISSHLALKCLPSPPHCSPGPSWPFLALCRVFSSSFPFPLLPNVIDAAREVPR